MGAHAGLRYRSRQSRTPGAKRVSGGRESDSQRTDQGRLLLSEAEKATLAEIAHRLGRKVLEEVASTAQPDTILGWYRKLIARKFDGSRFRQRTGRPKINPEMENLVVRMARENPGWGYDRIMGALANLGHRISDQTVGNILKRHGISPAPKRRQAVRWKTSFARTWRFWQGRIFFTVEVLTLKGLVTYYVLFFIHLESRRICIGGMTPYPDEKWMNQQARNVTLQDWGFLSGCRYVLHDRDTKFSLSFRQIMESGSVQTIRLPPKSPNLNAYAERWVRSVKEEWLSRANSVWRAILEAGTAAVRSALSPRAQSSRQTEPAVVSSMQRRIGELS